MDTTYRIEPVDFRALTDDEIRELNAYANENRREVEPDDPPTPDEVRIASVRNIPDFVTIRAWSARDEAGRLAGVGQCSWDSSAEDNRHLLESGVTVAAPHRRRGIGTALLARICEVAAEQNRPLLIGGTNERVPAAAAFAERVGAKAGQQMRISRLILADVDRNLVDTWVAEGPGRAEGYELVFIDGPYPRELYDDIIQAQQIMNTAPRDDLEIEDWTLKPEHIEAWDKELVATGGRRWSLYVRHKESGTFVGFTEVGWNPKIPGIRHQFGTAVEPSHRGHALGKWLKAEMVRRLLEDPDATEIRTGNAESNDAMLGINVQLGFAPFFGSTAWQLPLEAAQAYLASRS